MWELKTCTVNARQSHEFLVLVPYLCYYSLHEKTLQASVHIESAMLWAKLERFDISVYRNYSGREMAYQCSCCNVRKYLSTYYKTLLSFNQTVAPHNILFDKKLHLYKTIVVEVGISFKTHQMVHRSVFMLRAPSGECAYANQRLQSVAAFERFNNVSYKSDFLFPPSFTWWPLTLKTICCKNSSAFLL